MGLPDMEVCCSMLEKLYMAYKDDIFRYLVSLTNNPQLAEELVSETFLAALTSLHRFRGESSEKTWLISIARNTYFNYLRKSRIEVPLDMLPGIYISDCPLSSLLVQEKLTMVNRIIASLDERSRMTVTMRAQGFSYREIAEKLGINEVSARTLEFRARNKLKKILEKEGLL